MSKTDVAEIFYPVYRERSELLAKQMDSAEEHILFLRRWLRVYDPSLPIEYDGDAWSRVKPQLAQG